MSFSFSLSLPKQIPFLGSVLFFVSGAAATSIAIALQRRRAARRVSTGRSTTSSAAGGTAAYETRKAVDEYLQFHFGEEDPTFFPYPEDLLPRQAVNFCNELALLCERHCLALRDFTGERGPPKALDMGCAVGGATFALARAFPLVLGIDYSSYFVQAAKVMQDRGWMRYSVAEEGDLTRELVATVPDDIDRKRVKFRQGDACAIPANLGPFDAVLAANLLCRLPKPRVFLARLKSLVAPGGIAIIVSPYSWLQDWTPRQEWLGGYYEKNGKPIWSADQLHQELSDTFELVDQKDVSFLIREHKRKYQLGVSHATVWRRK